jgi:hypothetical protein
MTLPNDLTGQFFRQAAPVTLEIAEDGTPVMRIHDPYHPEAFLMVAGALAAMDALTDGSNEVTDAHIEKAERVACMLLDNAIEKLNNGARSVSTLVDFTPDIGANDEHGAI